MMMKQYEPVSIAGNNYLNTGRLTAERKASVYTYLALLAFAAAGIVYGNLLSNGAANIRVWNAGNLLIMLAGIPFLLLQTAAGIPESWQSQVATDQRIGYPLLTGLIFGLLDVLVIKLLMHPQPYTSMPMFLQPFPYSIFLFGSGAFEIEVFYRLIPMTLALLAGSKYKNGRYYTVFFWAAAMLTSVREPLEQVPDGGAVFITYSLLSGFLMNLLQAITFKRAGFVASLIFRLAHYLVWHILLGMYVQYFEVIR